MSDREHGRQIRSNFKELLRASEGVSVEFASANLNQIGSLFRNRSIQRHWGLCLVGVDGNNRRFVPVNFRPTPQDRANEKVVLIGGTSRSPYAVTSDERSGAFALFTAICFELPVSSCETFTLAASRAANLPESCEGLSLTELDEPWARIHMQLQRHST